jgi:hypothetical protein
VYSLAFVFAVAHSVEPCALPLSSAVRDRFGERHASSVSRFRILGSRYARRTRPRIVYQWLVNLATLANKERSRLGMTTI